ncbi:ATP-binding protein [Pseudonocardia sp. TRM90224]|uniref:ATP-binding protein n=1 Tax=Pseudonocardia sp. TRM90224 TaxID=2812678 RepID=UPI001E4709EA|nr:BTAD domain-containing putative transcriptional regulator [Pseudonocardia sp. TRM90224]
MPGEELVVRVLGATLVSDAAGRYPVDRPLERGMLVRLAMGRGVPVPDGRLAADLWGDAEVTRPAERLRVVAFRLRTALGPRSDAVTRSSAGYRLASGPADLIAAEAAADRMHAAARAGDHVGVRDAAAAALELWRGPSLADLRMIPFAESDGRRLDDWRLDLVVARLGAELELGAGPELTTELAGLANEHPLHEPISCMLAIALYRSGRQAEALERLSRLRRDLADELGVDPAPDTAELEMRLLRQDPALLPERPAPVTVPRQQRRRAAAVPAPTTSFVGRDQELSDLLAALATPGVTTLVGGPGSGKSRLAVEAAMAVAERDLPVAFVELAPLRLEDSVETAVAGAVGVEPGAGDRLGALAAALGSGLLVLDNAEHVVEQVADLVVQLRRVAPDLSILITSQRPLLIAEEVQQRVGPLELDAAAALLSARVAAGALPEDGLGTDVATILAAVDGLPLGIELAAGLTRTMTVPQLATRMTDRLRLLVGGPRDAGARHTSLRAALDWSHELLDPAAQAVLRRIGVFAGGFELDAAEQVVEGGAVQLGDVAPALADLVDRSLVTVVAERGGRRFTLLETVRDYALAQLDAAGETDPTLAKHLAWCLAHVRAAAAVDDFISAESVAAVFAEWPNILSALSHAPGTERMADALRLATAMHTPWATRGWFTEARRHFAALADAPGLNPHERGRALSSHGHHTMMAGGLHEARALLTAAAAVAGTVDDMSLVMRVRFQQGFVDYAQSRFVEAIATLEAGRDLAHKLGHVKHEWAFTDALGTAHLYAGDVDVALECYTAVVAVARERVDEPGLARGLSHLAQALMEAGRVDDAMAAADESDHYARRLDDRQVLPHNELIRGAAALAAGKLDDAEAACRSALTYVDSGAAVAHIDLADVLVARGELVEAGELLRTVYAGAAERGAMWLAALPVSAALALAAGDIAEARSRADEAAAAHAAAGFGWPRYVQRLDAVIAELTAREPT